MKMQGMKIFKKFLMPGGLCGAVPVIKSLPTSPEKPVECSNDLTEDKKLVRPSELPIYVKDETSSKDASCDETRSAPVVFIEESFGSVRRSVQGVVNEYVHVTDTVKDKFNTGIEHSSLLLDYLREESNAMPRMGAVVMGGLTGFIFGLRGGRFKRLVYTTTGVLAVAGVCYPKEAQESFVASKHYVNIGYNFIYGVKPGDEKQLEISWPELPDLKLPKSFSEFVDLVSATGASAAGAVGSLASKAAEAIKEEKPQEATPDKK